MTAVIDRPPAAPAPGPGSKPRPRPKRRWRPGWITALICLFAVAGAGVGLYPMTAAWISAYNQAQIIKGGIQDLETLDPDAEEQIRMAHEYNDKLQAGVALESGVTVPTGYGQAGEEFTYNDLLKANDRGLMSRVKIDEIDVDLPVYHGTDHQTLLDGAGHLEGSHLPVGGESTRSVITAHRGLASATMFNDLGDLELGDTFTLNTLGQVMVYEVIENRVIEPDDTETLLPVQGEDLVTLITCTPLGVNSHRIIVTGKRINPGPVEAVASAEADPEVGFPWWAVFVGGTLLLVGTYLTRSGFVDARRVDAKKARLAARAAAAAPEQVVAEPVAGFGDVDTNAWRVSHDGIEKT